MDFVLRFLRRRHAIILTCLLLSLPVTGLYLYAVPSTYTATAVMMIETRKGLQLQQSLLGDAPLDAAWIESQIGILQSQNVAAHVVKLLRLADDPEFARSDPDLLDRVLVRFHLKSAAAPRSDAERTGQATSAVMDGLDVRRLGPSYMMQIRFRWHNPEQATKVANAMIDGYIYEQLNAKYQANRRAGDWLQERLQSLREQATTAERAVIEFKAKNNIVAAGGALISDKQLSEIVAQLGTARAHVGDLQARLERVSVVRQAYQQGQPGSAADENVSEAMGNPIINGLRARYLELVNREADWSTKYGKTHIAVVNLRNQIRDIRKSIRDELGRIEETLKSDYEIAKRRQDDLEKTLASLVSRSTETNQAQIALFSLESAAQSYRRLYDNFLQRHTEAVQQQTFPISDARLVSPASVAQTGRALQAWMVTILAGGMLGVGLGALREIMDRGFRTGQQVRSVLQTECLALVPLLIQQGSNRMFGRAALPAPARASDSLRRGGILSTSSILQMLIESPYSAYAEAIRSIKLSIDLMDEGKLSKVVGLTSCLPSEGKSTIAAAIATIIAEGGARVALVDCDLRHHSLSRMLTPGAQAGFTDVVLGKVSLTEAMWSYPTNNLAFLPAAKSELPNAVEILASDAARDVFSSLQMRYDYVIVDLAPLVAGVDARAVSRLVGSYVLVIEWGSTKVGAVQYALRHVPGLQNRIVGAVLNKVDMAVLNRYDDYSANYYYYGQNPERRSMN